MSLSRVVWVTNHQAPYREPLWGSLAQKVDLHVLFLHPSQPHRKWVVEPSKHYDARVLRVWRLPFLDRLSTSHDDPIVALGMRELRGALRGSTAVIVGGWDQIPYMQLVLLSFLFRRPCIIFYESTNSTHRYNGGPVAAVRRFILRRADLVLTPGPAATLATIAAGVATSKILTSVNSIDVEGTRTLARLHRPSDQPGRHRFIFVGQLIARKNVDGVLRAFAELPGDPTLTVVGDGEDREALQSLANDLQVSERVFWHGHVAPDQVPVELATAQTLVLASHTEVWGMVVNEALACGLSVVAAKDVGVLSSLIDVRGVYACETDPASIAQAMATSARQWQGWDDGEDRAAALTPDAAADDALKAIRLTVASHRGGRRRNRAG